MPEPQRLTVLVADDEHQLRGLVGNILRNSGFNVLEATDGRDALEKIDSATVQIDLLVTDIVMPRMNGAELAAAFRDRQPSAKVLFISGYQQIVDQLHFDGNFLPKPFGPATLMNRVQQALNISSPGGCENSRTHERHNNTARNL